MYLLVLEAYLNFGLIPTNPASRVLNPEILGRGWRLESYQPCAFQFHGQFPEFFWDNSETLVGFYTLSHPQWVVYIVVHTTNGNRVIVKTTDLHFPHPQHDHAPTLIHHRNHTDNFPEVFFGASMHEFRYYNLWSLRLGCVLRFVCNCLPPRCDVFLTTETPGCFLQSMCRVQLDDD